MSEGLRLSELAKRKEQGERANIPPTEEKSLIEDVVKSDEPSEWHTYGGFLTNRQIDTLFKWCSDNDIILTEV